MNTLEKERVYDAYCTISDDFSSTRYSVWNCVKNFLDPIPNLSSLLEIGCGNGKNLLYRKDLVPMGTDFVPNMVSICHKRGLQCLQANALSLPFRDNSFDYTMSIAVFHHLSTDERRKQALEEMVRVTKPSGRGLLAVWAYEQENEGKKTAVSHKIEKGDNLIRWHGKGNMSDVSKAHRYYYFYDKETFLDYIKVPNIQYNNIYWESGNWILDFTKI